MYGRRKPTAEGQARAALLKFRRGVVNAMEWPEIKLVLIELEWPFDEVTAFAPVSFVGASSDAPKLFLKALGVPEAAGYWNASTSNSPNDPTRLNFYGYVGHDSDRMRAEHGAEPVEETHARFKVEALPATPVVDRVYITEVSPLKAVKKQGNPVLAWSARAQVGVKAYRIVAPDGQVGMAYQYPGEKRPRKGNIAQWMLDHGALPQVLVKLGLQQHIPGMAADRNINNTGTCGACENNVKRDARGRMVHHGYQRPGWGYIVGDCPGVGLLPHELSPEAAQRMALAINSAVVGWERDLQQAKAGEVTRLTRRRGYGANAREESVEPGHPDWKYLLQNHIGTLEGEIKQGKRALAEFLTKIQQWKCSPLPDGTVEPCKDTR